jgi:hypothetical protein
MKTLTIDDLLAGAGENGLALADVVGVNLAQPWLTVQGRTLTIVKEEEQGTRCLLEIQRPSLVRSQVNMTELRILEKLIRERCVGYTVAHHPPYSFKGQGDRWRATLELLCGRGDQVTITLVDIGVLYSAIQLNGEPVLIQHGAGTERGGWVNRTDGFTLVGAHRLRALKSLITCLGKKK